MAAVRVDKHEIGDPLSVPCPWCGAPKGEPCQSRPEGGVPQTTRDPHQMREAAADRWAEWHRGIPSPGS